MQGVKFVVDFPSARDGVRVTQGSSPMCERRTSLQSECPYGDNPRSAARGPKFTRLKAKGVARATLSVSAAEFNFGLRPRLARTGREYRGLRKTWSGRGESNARP